MDHGLLEDDFVKAELGTQKRNDFQTRHKAVNVGKGNLDFMEYQIRDLKPDTWKGYNIATAAKVDFDPNSDMRRWRLDDPDVAFPTYDLIRKHATKEKM